MTRYFFCFLLLSFSCARGLQPQKNVPGDDASSSVVMALPDPGPSHREYLNGYRLRITPVEDSCNEGTKIDETGSYKHGHSVKAALNKACSYWLKLEAGLLDPSSDGKIMGTVYLSNVDQDGASHRIDKSLFSNEELRVSIILRATEKGVERGFGNVTTQDPTPSDTSTDSVQQINIEATIEGGSSKLPVKPLDTYENCPGKTGVVEDGLNRTIEFDGSQELLGEKEPEKKIYVCNFATRHSSRVAVKKISAFGQTVMKSNAPFFFRVIPVYSGVTLGNSKIFMESGPLEYSNVFGTGISKNNQEFSLSVTRYGDKSGSNALFLKKIVIEFESL